MNFMDITTLAISSLGLVLNIALTLVHNKTFVERYKKYKEHVNQRIIESLKQEFGEIIKEKNASIIEKKLSETIKKVEEQIKPIESFNLINQLVVSSIILFSASIICSLLIPIFTNKVGGFSMSNLSYAGLFFGVLFLLGAVYKVFSLSKQVSEYELAL